MRMLIATLLLGCGIAAADSAAVDTIDLEDYAWRFPIRLDAQSDVHVLTLTPEVYRSVFDTELGDLHLITREGREVSFGPLPVAPLERWRETPWAMQRVGTSYEPIDEDAPRAFPGIEIERDDHQFGLKLRSGEYAARATLKVRSNSEQKVPIRALRIEWSAFSDLPEGTRWWVEGNTQNGDVIFPDRVSTRYDALHARGETRLTFAAQELIDQAPLRILVEAIPSSLSFDAVFAEYEPDPEYYRHSIALKPVQFQNEAEHHHGFMLSGPFPVHAASIELAAGDALASISLMARDTNSPWWQGMGSTTAFDVKVDRAQFERGRIHFDPTRHRQWLLQSTPELSAPPRLKMYYRPDQFLIAHRGPDDLILLAGHRTARRQPYPIVPLIEDLRNRLGDRWQPEPASIGMRIEVRGKAALAAPPAKPNYRKWGLWFALVFGAAMIAWMAISLLNESHDAK
jgi:Protein of unknown function (DUF3999)